MNALSPEKLFDLFHEFVLQAQTGNQETKKYNQKIDIFNIKAGFGKGSSSRVPWFGFFAAGQTAQCGIYPVCLYYKKHDLFIVAYGISETNPPSVMWGPQVTGRINVFSELEKRGISSEYKNRNSTGAMYGDSLVKASFEHVSLISDSNNDIFKDIYLNISEILKEYQNILPKTHSAHTGSTIIIRQQEKHGSPSIGSYIRINMAELEQMKLSFQKSFPEFKLFSSSSEYIAAERQYKDDLRNIFNIELRPLLEDKNIESARNIPSTIDKILRTKLPTTGTNQNIIHWLSWSYLQDIDAETAQEVGSLFRSLLDETIDLELRLDNFEKKYTTILDEKAPPRTGRRSWQGILRPITSFILAFTFPEKYLFVRTEIIKRVSERLLGNNICADYTARKITLGKEYTRIMAMSEQVREALADWQPQDFIDIQSFFWVAVQGVDSGHNSPDEIPTPPEVAEDHSDAPGVLPSLAENVAQPYVEPDFPTIKNAIQKSGLVLADRTLRRYHLSLKNRKFVILAGVSGTGKTWLAEEYAKAIGAEYINIPVAPNWTSNEDLLGFHNPVSNSFQPTEFTRFLENACNAQQQADAQGEVSRPFHLILDEMNLARVEHYFARFLSAMELRHRKAAPCLFLGPGKELSLPANLHFIGTVNVDETTYGFADKVFDRAQLIELPLQRDLIAAHLEGKEYAQPLMAFWDILQNVAPFAFRILDDITAYITAAEEMGVHWNEALDEMLVQKILPRIKGNDSHLTGVFDSLDAIAAEYNFSLAAEKIAHMRASYHEHGFTSFFR